MKKILLSLLASLFLLPSMASAISVPWNRPVVGEITPLYILDDVKVNRIVGTSTTATSTINSLSVVNLEVTGKFYMPATVITPFTQCSVIFTGVAGVLAQDNSGICYDDTNNRLGIGTASPAYTFDVVGNIHASNIIRLENNKMLAFGSSNGEGITGNQSTNSVSLITNTLERVRIDSSGNVGIGTITPNIQAAAAGNAVLTIQGNSSTTNGQLELASGANSLVDGFSVGSQRYYNGTQLMARMQGRAEGTAGTSGSFSINTTNAGVDSEKFRITAAGNVGINTTAPTFKLHVTSANVSDTQTLGAASGGFNVSNVNPLYGMQFGVLSNGNGWIQQGRNDGTATAYNLLLQTLGGNVGIGTASPQAKLHVLGGGTAGTPSISASTMGVFQNSASAGVDSLVSIISGNTGTSQLLFGDTDAEIRGRVAYLHTSDAMALYTANGERMRIDSSGSVGIGTTNPQQKLSVSTTGNTYGIAVGDSGSATGKILSLGYFLTGDYGVIEALHPGTAYKNIAISPNGGNVGVGTTSPGAKLHVANGLFGGGINVNADLAIESSGGTYISLLSPNTEFNGLVFGDPQAWDAGAIYYNHPSNYLRFDTNGAEKMRINSSGFMGIGTTTPGQNLVVTGTSPTAQFYDTSGGDRSALFGHIAGNAVVDSLGGGWVILKAGGTAQASFTNGGGAFGSYAGVNAPPSNGLIVSGDVGIGTNSPANNPNFTTLTLNNATNGGVIEMKNNGTSNFQMYNTAANARIQTLTAIPLTFATNGDSNERMRIQSDGTVGINTTAPNVKLSVTGSSGAAAGAATNGIAQFTTGTGGVADEMLQFGIVDGSYSWIQAEKPGTATRYLVLQPVAGAASNVGIGDTAPANKLSVVGNVTAISSGNDPYFEAGDVLGNDMVRMQYNSAGNYGYINSFSGGGAAKLILAPNGGKVGIGTTTPSHALDISSGADGDALKVETGAANNSYTAGMRFTVGTGGDTGAIRSKWTNNIDTNYLSEIAFYANGTSQNTLNQQMVIQGNGNVGIGTTTPTVNLAVQNASEGNTLQLYDTDGNCRIDPDSGGLTTTCSSDERLKKDITVPESSLDYLLNIPIKDFTLKASGDRKTGVIAQELMKTHPELVHMQDDGFYGVESINSWELVHAIQEQQKEIESLKQAKGMAPEKKGVDPLWFAVAVLVLINMMILSKRK